MELEQKLDRTSPTSRRMQARIIEAVVETVAKHGISGTTLAAVARQAQVSQGVLVFHFKSKEKLLEEALVRLLDEYRATWIGLMAIQSPVERVVSLVKADFTPEICTGSKLATWFAFWGEASAKPVYNRLSAVSEEERFEAMKLACTDLSRVARVSDPVRLAQSIDAHTDGLWLQMHIQGRSFTRGAALEAALAHLRLLLPDIAGMIE